LLLLSLMCFAIMAKAGEDTFVISDIRIEGLQRVPVATVFANLPFNIHDQATPELIRDGIARLFRTANFNDVEIGREDTVLVVKLQERPSIADIKIEGNKAIKEQDLLDGLKKAGLAEGLIFKQATL